MANDPARNQAEKVRDVTAARGQPGTDTSPQSEASTRYDCPPPDDLSLWPGGRPVPGFELAERLGSGGYGEVWKAHGPGGFPVALKFIRLGDQAGAVELRSLEVMRGIRHPHLLGLFGAWKQQDLLIVAMELGDRTLYHRLQEARRQGLPGIPGEELLEYMRGAAWALDHLNASGVQHRDVKPQNLLLVGGGVKVADFGLAKLLEQTAASNTGALTPAYAAPEFLKGRTSDRSDQYALAVSYCQLRGGRLPFEGGPAQVLAGHLMMEPDLSMLPEEERAVVARALAKEPADRWPTCRAFVQALAQDTVRGAAPAPPPAREEKPFPSPPSPPPVPTEEANGGPAAASLPGREESPSPSAWRQSPRRRRGVMLAGGILLVLLALPAALVCLVVVARNGQTEGTNLADTAPGRPADRAEGPPPTRPAGPPQEPPQPPPADAPREAVPKEVVNSIGMKLVLIPAGKFLMGSPADEEGRYDDEGPQHEVEVTRPSYLGRYEVTRGQFRRFVGDTAYRTDAERDGVGGGGFDAEKSAFCEPKAEYSWRDPGFVQTDEHPVVNVSWDDAQAFCDWLSRKEGKTYRLPTEAEWEYSCRANARTRFHGGDEDSSLRRVANIADLSLKAEWNYQDLTNKHFQRLLSEWFEIVTWDDGYPFTAPVGRFQPNGFGLYDMHGNVWEWCADWYDKDYFKDSPTRDPRGPSAGSFRVARGGSVLSVPRRCRAAIRGIYGPAYRNQIIGFRVVCER
jgi:formylglycine-generating enzyme required for sulfatase activity/serine/threonine protein kinase